MADEIVCNVEAVGIILPRRKGLRSLGWGLVVHRYGYYHAAYYVLMYWVRTQPPHYVDGQGSLIT